MYLEIYLSIKKFNKYNHSFKNDYYKCGSICLKTYVIPQACNPWTQETVVTYRFTTSTVQAKFQASQNYKVSACPQNRILHQLNSECN